MSVLKSKIPWHRKLEIFLDTFCIQKFLCHWTNFGFYCMLVPLSIFTPEVRFPALCLGTTCGHLVSQVPWRVAIHVKWKRIHALPVVKVSIPMWALVHLPAAITVTTAMFTVNGWRHALLYVLFENAMGVVKISAAFAGVLQC